MRRVCSYTYAAKKSQYRDDVWPSMPRTDIDDEIDRLSSETCPFCHGELGELNLFDEMHEYERAATCNFCGWWRLRHVVVGGQDNCSISLAIGEACHYDVDSLEVPIQDLRRHLKTHNVDLANVNPTVFEKLMGDCVRSAFGPCEVVHVGGTGDGGVDLNLIQNDKTTFLVQVKRRSNLSKHEGVQVVRELNGVLFREGAAKGMIITTASGFTKAAFQETMIKTPTKSRYEMLLLAFNDIIEMLNLPSPVPYEPWQKYRKSS
jgi:restriction system protein